MTQDLNAQYAAELGSISVERYLHWCLMVGMVVCTWVGFFAPDEYWAVRLALVSLVVLVLQFAHVIRRFSSIGFELWFLLVSWVFMFGQVWLVGLGGERYLFYPLLLRYDTGAIAVAGAFALCYMQALFLGLTGTIQPDATVNPAIGIGAVSNQSLRLATKLGTVLAIFALPFRLFEDFRNVSSAQATGSFLAVTSSAGPADDFGKLIVPALLALIVGAMNRPALRRTYFWGAVGYHVLVLVLSGDRRYAVTALLALGLCYLACFGLRLSWRTWVGYFLSGLLLLNLLAYIRSIRQGGLTGLGALISDAPARLIALNPVIESLAEFGVSLMSVVLAVIYVPGVVPYQLGYSYTGALATLLPRGWVGDGNFDSVSVGDLLAGLDGHAVGASPAGELFANFGWWGLVGGFVLGRILGWAFMKANAMPAPINLVVYYSLFYILINLARAAFVEVFRASILVSVPVILIWVLLQRTPPKLSTYLRPGKGLLSIVLRTRS